LHFLIEVVEQLLSITDYIIGVFRAGFIIRNKVGTDDDFNKMRKDIKTIQRDYDRLRGKIRFIKVDTIKKPFTYKNPFVIDI
jgi:hypothetical protein